MTDTEHIQLAHGGGGQLTAELIADVILPALGGGQQAGRLTDAAVLSADGAGRLAFTTDSYVVQPLEFPGGDIGKLAVCGTINDLAVVGARPAGLSVGLIIEEGLEIETLRRMLESAGRAAAEADVPIVTGDTKVVQRGALDSLMINTAGVGMVLAGADLGFDRIEEGDRIVLSGPLGEHGLAVMGRRKGLTFAGDLKSDCAAIHELAAALVEELGPALHFMRDPTRGGLAAVLAEFSSGAGRDLAIDEAAIPVRPSALAAAEILGLDLLTVANEGKLVAVVSDQAGDEAVAILSRYAIAKRAADIGQFCEQSDDPWPQMLTAVGGRRVIQMPYGEDLPRIC